MTYDIHVRIDATRLEYIVKHSENSSDTIVSNGVRQFLQDREREIQCHIAAVRLSHDDAV